MRPLPQLGATSGATYNMEKFLDFSGNHTLLVLALLISFFVLLFTEFRRKAGGLVSVEPTDAVGLINNDAMVFDLRNAESFGRGHIVNAKNIPFDEFDAKHDKIKKFKNKSIVTVCDSGTLRGPRPGCRSYPVRKPSAGQKSRSPELRPPSQGSTGLYLDQEISMADKKKDEKKNQKKDEADKRISINKIYLKDFSFESPQAPSVFRSGDWKPQTNLNLRSNHSEVEGTDNLHEVVLTITVDAKDGDTTLFLVEIQQSGLFEISGYDGEELSAIIGSFCPNILFPYARESIAGIIQKGGFPEFVLQPINFDSLYMQSRQQAAQIEAEGTEKH